MALSIKTASIRDLDSLCTIEKVCFETEAFSRQQIASLLTDYDSITLIAYESERIAGFIIGRLYAERKALTGHLLTIDVLPDFRRHRVGTELLQKIERLFRDKGAKACRLEVREGNLAALSLYQKLGYESIAKLRNYYGSVHGISFRKDLT
jgi:ribosomal protein S18 acetylase RimI-like enzyme